MKVSDIAEKLGLTLKAGEGGISKEVSGCYIGDLLSLAMARLTQGNVWITIQTNINIVAVSSLSDIGCIILAEGLSPDENAAQKADMEDIPIYSSDKTAYELATALSECGI